MSDLLTKVKAALDSYEMNHTRRYELSELSPDMARALIVAGELADAVMEQANDGRESISPRVSVALVKFYAAMEGKE